ncbi:MAG: NAD(P)/FAD-dependent oxidoreductase, partial [Acidimicrobiia bacterium]
MSKPVTGGQSAPDRRNPSLWLATSDSPEFPSLPGDITVPALVIGSGITGLTAARMLADEGLTVCVIDAGRLCSGVTAFTTAKLTALQSTIYSELSADWGQDAARVYAEANLAAIDTVRRRIADDAIDCELREEPAYTYTESSESVALIESEVDAARQAGLDVEFTTESDLPYEIQGAVRLDNQARFHPRRYCLGLIRGLVRDGAALFENTRALDIDREAAVVTTDRGTITADVIVVASHIPFVNTGAYFARMTVSRSYAIAVKSGEPPLKGMYISVDEPIRSVRAGVGHTIVGGESHPVGDDPDTTRRFRALETWARERLDNQNVEFRWSAQDYRSVDGLPYIGRLGSSGRVYVATGFAKWGMTNGTSAARIMVDLAMGRPNPWATVFDSKR